MRGRFVRLCWLALGALLAIAFVALGVAQIVS